MKRIITIILLLTISLSATELTDYQKNYIKSFVLEEKKSYSKAIEELVKIYPKYQYDYELNLRLGWLYYQNKENKKSINYLKKTMLINENAIEPLNMILLPLTSLKNLKDAKKYSSIVIKKSPANYYAHLRIAYLYYILKKYDKALYHYNILNSFYPSDTSTKLGMAATLLKLKKYDKARGFYISILKVSPYHQIAYNGYLATFKK